MTHIDYKNWKELKFFRDFLELRALSHVELFRSVTHPALRIFAPKDPELPQMWLHSFLYVE